MKVNLIKLEECERKQGRDFLKRLKEAWDAIYKDKPMSAQTLRNNIARFRKGKSLLNLIKVKDKNDVGPNLIEVGRMKQIRIK